MITIELPLDVKFIDGTIEPLTQKLQRLIGVDCFFWAKLSFIVAVIANILLLLLFFFYLILSFSKGSFLDSTEDCIVIIVNVFILLYLLHEWRCKSCGVKATRRRVYEMIESGLKNPLILFPRPLMFLAITFLVLTILDLSQMSYINVLVGFVFKTPFVIGYLATCFKACTPLPPKKSRLGEIADKVKEFFTEPIDSPIPEPA